MEVILEPISPETTNDVPAPTPADDPPPPAELARAPSVLPLTNVPEPDAPVKRPRGRPPKRPATPAAAEVRDEEESKMLDSILYDSRNFSIMPIFVIKATTS